MARRGLWGTGLLVAAILSLGGHGAASGSELSAPGDQPVEATGTGRLPCTSVHQELNFAHYWAGPSFDGLRVTAVVRNCALPVPDEPGRTNDVTVIYGDCVVFESDACDRIQVQSWPAEERTRELYETGPVDPPSPEATDTTIGGIPATWYGTGPGAHLDIYRPDATVVIFGDDRALMERFAGGLVKGPARLDDLSAHGIVFDPGCADDPHYCVAEPALTPTVDLQAVLPLAIPAIAFLLALLVGRWWVVLLPPATWLGFFLGMDQGWWGYGFGDGWLFGFAFASVQGIAAAGLGLLLRAMLPGVTRARPHVT